MESSLITGIISDHMFFMQVNIKLLIWGNCASHEELWNQRGNKGVLLWMQKKQMYGLTVINWDFYELYTKLAVFLYEPYIFIALTITRPYDFFTFSTISFIDKWLHIILRKYKFRNGIIRDLSGNKLDCKS